MSVITAHKQHLKVNYSPLVRWHQGEQTVTLSLAAEPALGAMRLILDRLQNYSCPNSQLMQQLLLSDISTGKGLPRFYISRNYVLTLCSWRLNAAVCAAHGIQGLLPSHELFGGGIVGKAQPAHSLGGLPVRTVLCRQ